MHWVSDHLDVITAMAAVVGAGSAFMSWVCTVIADYRSKQRDRQIKAAITKANAKDSDGYPGN